MHRRVQFFLATALVTTTVWFCTFNGAGALGLIGPDEPRYAAVAREMAIDGDWVTPKLHGVPWFEKPVLYYWMAASAFRVFGVSETTARLPSSLTGLLLIGMLAWLCRRLYGWPTAYALLLILPTTVAAIGFSRAATHDMVFASALGISLVAAVRIVYEQIRDSSISSSAYCCLGSWYTWILLWGVSLGAAVLAKGPAALVLAGGSIGFWILITGRWKIGLALVHPVAILAFMLVALPWYVACALQNPSFIQTFLIEHNIQRYLTPVFRHEQPVWFYGQILLVGLVPWTVLLLNVVRDIKNIFVEGKWRSSVGLFIGCWVLFPLLFFSLSSSKLPGYILPAVPPLVLLIAHSTTRVAIESPRVMAKLVAMIGGTFILLGIFAVIGTSRLPIELQVLLSSQSTVIGLTALLSVTGLIVVLLGFWQRIWTGLSIAAIGMAIFLTGITGWVIPQLDARLTARALAAEVQHVRQEQELVSVHQLHRSWHYGLNYYLERSLPTWTNERTGLVIASQEGVLDIRGEGYDIRVMKEITEDVVLARILSLQKVP